MRGLAETDENTQRRLFSSSHDAGKRARNREMVASGSSAEDYPADRLRLPVLTERERIEIAQQTAASFYWRRCRGQAWMDLDEVRSEACIIMVERPGEKYDGALRLSIWHGLERWWRGQVRVYHYEAQLPERTDEDASDAVGCAGIGGVRPERAMVALPFDLLTEQERDVVGLIYFQGLAQEEAAAAMGLNQATVSRLKARALDKLSPQNKLRVAA